MFWLQSYRSIANDFEHVELAYLPCPAIVCADGRAAACCGHTAAGTWHTSSQRPAYSPPTRWDCGCSEPLDTGSLQSRHWGSRHEYEDWRRFLLVVYGHRRTVLTHQVASFLWNNLLIYKRTFAQTINDCLGFYSISALYSRTGSAVQTVVIFNTCYHSFSNCDPEKHLRFCCIITWLVHG